MAHVLKGSHSFTCTPRVYPLTEWTIPAFAFPAEAGTHLPTPEGWKAELALMSMTKTETQDLQDQYWESVTGMDCDKQKDWKSHGKQKIPYTGSCTQ